MNQITKPTKIAFRRKEFFWENAYRPTKNIVIAHPIIVEPNIPKINFVTADCLIGKIVGSIKNAIKKAFPVDNEEIEMDMEELR